MSTRTVKVRLLSLSHGKLGYFCRTSTDESRKCEYAESAQAGEPGLHLTSNFVTRQGAALSPLQEHNESLPRPNQAGFFIADSTWPSFLSAAKTGRTAVRKDTDDEFHNSATGIDIYALYNAVNGKMRGRFLDVSELDKYSPADAEALNVPRLKEIWEHTRTDCDQCREIIDALDAVRGAIRDVVDTTDQDD